MTPKKRILRTKSHYPQITKIQDDAKVYLSHGDVIVHAISNQTIDPGDETVIRTGVSLYLPDNVYCKFRTISVMFINNSVYIHPAKNEMFSDDTGELLIILRNDGRDAYVIPKDSPVALIKFFRSNVIRVLINEVAVK